MGYEGSSFSTGSHFNRKFCKETRPHFYKFEYGAKKWAI